MTNLITLLREAKTGSRELDARAWCWLNDHRFECVSEVPPRDVVVSDPSRSIFAHYPLRQVPNLTTSLDALILVKEERLSGWKMRLDELDMTERYLADLWKGEAKVWGDHSSDRHLAFLIAIVKALEIEG